MKTDLTIKVRFAPSPTGYLHIGGVRTALFNYLFAHHHHGRFFVRIEDTDKVRSKSEMTEQILSSLRWLGLNWDGDIIFQSRRLDAYQELCQILFRNGHAYPCFCSPDLLAEKRKKAEKEIGGYQYDRQCLYLSREEIQKKLDKKNSYVLRFRVPEGNIVFEDIIHGKTVFKDTEIDDFIIQRSDGTPVYQITVVTDDHDMGITHVIRGDDHLTNTPKQILIYQAMGWKTPVFVHLPMILGSDKKRLSKRHGATSVEEYRNMGFLPQSIVNYLALLGWSPGDDREILTMQELIDTFSLDRVSKKSAVFDENKLIWMNEHYIRSLSNESLLAFIQPELMKRGFIDHTFLQDHRSYMFQYIDLLKPKIKKLVEFIDRGSYFFRDPESYESTAVEKYWKNHGVVDLLRELLKHLENLENWNESILEKEIRSMAEARDMGASKLIHPVRLAITGYGVSPGLFELMEVLGRERVLRRIHKAIQYLS